MEIRYCNIPSYLHAGSFYRNLSTDDPEGSITIPADCFLSDCQTVSSIHEFRQLLRVYTFWILDMLPTSVLDFCWNNKFTDWEDDIAGLPEELKDLLKKVYGEPNVVPIEEIVKMGRWDIIHHSVGRMVKVKSAATAAAAKVGNLDVLRLLHEEGFPWHDDTCSFASLRGHLACLKYAHENGCPWDERVYSYAVQNGRLDIMEYAHQQGLQWNARYRGQNIFDDVCRSAAEHGYLNCLVFAHNNGCPWDSRTTAAAAGGGHIECLEYALDNHCPVDESACSDACRNGQLACLKVLHQRGAPWDAKAPVFADMPCLQYLYEHRCPWDNSSLVCHARRGRTEILRYAIEQGCVCESSLMKDSTYAPDADCMRYLLEDQLLGMDEELFKTALLNANFACFQYLIDLGCPFLGARFDPDGAWRYAAHNEHKPEFVQCVKYVIERQWVPDAAFLDFVRNRAPECEEWLKQETDYLVDSGSDSENSDSGEN